MAIVSFEVKVNFSPSETEARIKKALEFAQLALDASVKKSMWQFTPYKTGEMMGDLTGVGTGYLTYPNSPQAQRLYYGISFNFTKDHHPNASSMWFERAKELDKDKWLQVAQRAADMWFELNPGDK